MFLIAKFEHNLKILKEEYTGNNDIEYNIIK